MYSSVVTKKGNAGTWLKTAVAYSVPIHLIFDNNKIGLTGLTGLTFEPLRPKSTKPPPGVEVRSNVSRPLLAAVCDFGRKDKVFSSARLLKMDRYGTTFGGTDEEVSFSPRLSPT